MRPIIPGDWLPPRGHYSPAIEDDGTVYLSGQLPIDPRTGCFVQGEVEAQVERVFDNIEELLRAVGGGLDCLRQVTVYTPDMALWERINVTYARRLGAHRPARVVVPTGPLHYGCQIEVAATARLAKPSAQPVTP